jgi:LysM repeat protein
MEDGVVADPQQGPLLGGRSWKAFAAPAAFLLAVTIAVVVLRSTGGGSPAKTPSRPAHAAVKKPPPGVTRAPRLYTVKAGDTVTDIAAKTHVSVVRIRALNPSVRPTALFVGEKIRLR